MCSKRIRLDKDKDGRAYLSGLTNLDDLDEASFLLFTNSDATDHLSDVVIAGSFGGERLRRDLLIIGVISGHIHDSGMELDKEDTRVSLATDEGTLSVIIVVDEAQ